MYTYVLCIFMFFSQFNRCLFSRFWLIHVMSAQELKMDVQKNMAQHHMMYLNRQNINLKFNNFLNKFKYIINTIHVSSVKKMNPRMIISQWFRDKIIEYFLCSINCSVCSKNHLKFNYDFRLVYSYFCQSVSN